MAMNTFERREVLKALGAGTLVLGWPRLTAAATGGDARLIVVILRGGMDGLAAVQPHGEAQYAALRGALAAGDAGHKLDGTFALHPALAQCAQLYRTGELAVVHAVAPPYHGRSHFEAQDCLENGGDAPHQTQDGWLNRALSALPGAEGLAIASAMPLILRGAGGAETWSPSPLPEASPDLVQRLGPLYARDPQLADAFERAAGMGAADADGMREGLALRLPAALREAAKFMSGRDGLRVVVVQDGGWDTHARQAAALAAKLGALDKALDGARTQLGTLWPRTLIVVATEFGRTVRANGTGGTDHGTGGVMLVAGGAVRGGKVYGDWPGLAPSALLDGRDLKPTTDSRAVFKTLLRDHLDVPEAALGSRVFPDSAAAHPLDGFVRT